MLTLMENATVLLRCDAVVRSVGLCERCTQLFRVLMLRNTAGGIGLVEQG